MALQTFTEIFAIAEERIHSAGKNVVRWFTLSLARLLGSFFNAKTTTKESLAISVSCQHSTSGLLSREVFPGLTSASPLAFRAVKSANIHKRVQFFSRASSTFLLYRVSVSLPFGARNRKCFDCFASCSVWRSEIVKNDFWSERGREQLILSLLSQG